MKYFAALLLFILIENSFLNAQWNTIQTVAGCGIQGYAGDGESAIVAQLYWPACIAFDRKDNMFIADQWNNRIRRIDAITGIITTVAGNGIPGYSGDNITATSAEINLPAGLCVDDSDNIFIADFNNNRVREVVNATGFIYTIAGNGIEGIVGDGGPATAAEIDHPHQTACDNHGDVYISDENNNKIRKVVLSTGVISTVVGTGRPGYAGDGGPAITAELNSPKCIFLDDSDNMYIADWLNNRIRKVSVLTGFISTVAGNGMPGFDGDNGPATAAELNDPYRVALDSSGNMFIADGSDNRVRWVNKTTHTINTLAGNGESGFWGDGGPAQDAELDYPPGVAVNKAGNVFIADLRNNRIREVVNPTGSDSFKGKMPRVSVFPNPANTSTIVNISGDGYGESVSMFLYTITGQMVWQINNLSNINEEEIPLTGFSPGVYLLEVRVLGTASIWNRIDIIR
jgi:trimeric autotransporter adhesin